MDEIYDGQIVGDTNATVMSGCQVEPGIVGNSVYFDGVSASADLGNQRHRWVCTEDGTEYSEELDISLSTRTNKWNFKHSRAWMDGEIYSKKLEWALDVIFIVHIRLERTMLPLSSCGARHTTCSRPYSHNQGGKSNFPLALWQRVSI